MKHLKIISVIVALAFLYSSCATTKFFRHEYTDQNGNVIKSDTIAYVDPFGLLNSWKKEKGVNYKISIGSVICSVVFFPTIIIPVTMLGFFLFDAKSVDDPGYKPYDPADDELVQPIKNNKKDIDLYQKRN